MRILWWQEAFGPRPGGVQIVAEQVLRRLRERGHVLGIIASHGGAELSGDADWEGIPLWHRPFSQALRESGIEAIAAARRALDALAGAFAPDVVHINGFGPSALFHLENARLRRVPLLLALHSSDTLSGGATTLVRQTLERADWVTACSRSLLDAACASVPGIAARASVVHNGVDVSALAPAPFPIQPRVLCIGILAPHKGFDLAVRALAILLRRFPDLRLVLAGEGPSRDELERLARDEGVAGAVDFAGVVRHADVSRLINATTLVAVPSRREPFGLVAAEAALMSRPVVAARRDGLPEIVRDGETGILVEPESSAALATAIGALLADPSAAQRLGAAGRRRAQQSFSVARQVDTFEALYRRIVERRRAGAGSRPASRGAAELV